MQPITRRTNAPRTPQGAADLDEFDAALIRALQADGRASIHDLAIQLGASRDFVAQRMHLLTHGGGLRVVAALDPGFVGHHVLVHAKVEVDGPIAPIAEEVIQLPDAVFVSMTSGPLPLVFESRHGDGHELLDMLDHVRRLPTVRRVLVSTYVEVLKGFFVSHGQTDIVLDRIDYELIAVLQQDGRTSYRALADTVHLSPSSTRARVQRLIDAGVIRIAAIKSGSFSRNRLAIGVGITIDGPPDPIREFVMESPYIDFAVRCHGSYDFIATLVSASSSQLLPAMDAMRGLPGVSALDSWTHYDIVKEDYARTLGRVLVRE
ncbi:Lrp/AsnC family transcriptional regulator [Leucobacter manosquensis]|uniref:Lrp/AsnC family transcriptional regulator n=1 Tax=Leucobacter manosquensis TaxID=2810611 RepID=A0ABS5M7X3_9MICO|nr:Lrp/AsnC family transcriptional regulator [Leucobacter manosquensis]